MFEWIAAKLGAIAVDTAVQWSIGGVITWAVLYVLKKIPNDVIKARFGLFMYGLGVLCTLGVTKWFTRWKFGKKLWDIVETWILDLVENIVVYGIAEWLRGMRSDNKMKDQTVLKTK